METFASWNSSFRDNQENGAVKIELQVGDKTLAWIGDPKQAFSASRHDFLDRNECHEQGRNK